MSNKFNLSAIFESFKASKDAAIADCISKAEDADSESTIDALASIAGAHNAKKIAVQRMEKNVVTERHTSTFARVLGSDDGKIQAAIAEWSRHSPKKSAQMTAYLTTGRAPGASETACYAPLFEAMARGELAEMTRHAASETIRKFRSLKEGTNLPQNKDYCVNNYNSFLTLLSAPDKGFCMLTPRYDGRSIAAWTLTNKGRWIVNAAIRARSTSVSSI